MASLAAFIPPLTDGSVPLDAAVDFHLQHNPKHVFAVLYDIGSRSQTDITYEQLGHAVHRAAQILNPGATIPQGTNLGVLISADTITYITLILGAIRAGLVPFPISPRTQIEGIAHLFSETRTSRVLLGGGPMIDQLYKQVDELLKDQSFKLESIPIPSFGDLYPHLGQEPNTNSLAFEKFPTLEPTTSKPTVVILHSSGSTGLPRAVPYDQEGVFKNIINQPMIKTLGGPGVRTGLMAVPTFHATGVMIQCLMPLYQGYTPVLFAPRSEPVVPTPDLTLQALSETDCETTLAWPAFLEAWAEDQEAISRLKRLKAILFGGGPLAERIGDHLVTNGVNIQIGYAGTEFGAGNHACPPGYDPRDWIYFQFSSQMNVKLVPQYDEQGSHEVYFLLGPDNKPFVINSSLDGTPAYSTKDLVAPHPTKQGLWKLVGRADDQITLSNGEKINPGPIENSVLKSPLVQFAVMFGREKSQCGVLLELTNDGRELFLKGCAEILESIWPYIEQANTIGPTHARLAKDTVIFAAPDHPLPRTPKGSVSRPSALKIYAEEIERMYAALEKSEAVTRDHGTPSSWSDLAVVEDWIQSCVESILGSSVDVGGDLFQQGLDSLTAAILLRIIKSSMHTSSNETVRAAEATTSRNTVFDYPTVKQLAIYLVRLWDGNIGDSSQDRSDAAIIEELRLTTQKYQWKGDNLRAGTGPKPLKESVVLTGGTGGLGCHLLACLLADDNVQRVWVLNRKSRDIIQSAEERQTIAFEDKLLDSNLLEHPKLVILEANLAAEQCGLAQESYKQIQSEATMIIHNAWQVNFNLTLPSFAPSLQGVQNLLKLTFSSTASTGAPRFIFASSISALGFDQLNEPLKEEYVSLEHGIKNIGYGRSKLVAEKLLEHAGTLGLETCSIRLGQLTGDEKSGAWSINDWVPAMIASSVSIGCLPASSGMVSWIPLDVAARAIHEVCMERSVTLPPVVHCCHPQPISWSDMIVMLADVVRTHTPSGTKLAIVPFTEWNKKVAAAASNFEGTENQKHRKYPSTKIQEAFGGTIQAAHSDSDDGRTRTGSTALDMAKGQKLSRTLNEATILNLAYVKRWVAYWERKGLFG